MTRQSGGEITQLRCVSCGGRGSSTCTACGGIGHSVMPKSRIRFDRTVECYHDHVACTACFGSGRITCVSCRGLGWVGRSDTLTSGTADDEPPRVFQFPPHEFVRHPTRRDIWACWQYHPGHCLDIGLTLTRSMRLELTGLDTDTWLDIRDYAGNPVPLSVLIGSTGGLSGRWL